MTGITELATLLETLVPELGDDKVVFCSVPGKLSAYGALEPLATCCEAEGLTLVLSESQASANHMTYDGVFREITLSVHSSLHAVGLTAIVATRLAEQGISANVIAGYYHDHIFVPEDRAEDAMLVLRTLS